MKMLPPSLFKFYFPLFSSSKSFFKIPTLCKHSSLNMLQKKFSIGSFSWTSTGLQSVLKAMLAKLWRYFSPWLRLLTKSIISLDFKICTSYLMSHWKNISMSVNSIFPSSPLKLLLALPKPTTQFLETKIMKFWSESSTFFWPEEKHSTKELSAFSGPVCKSWEPKSTWMVFSPTKINNRRLWQVTSMRLWRSSSYP